MKRNLIVYCSLLLSSSPRPLASMLTLSGSDMGAKINAAASTLTKGCIIGPEGEFDNIVTAVYLENKRNPCSSGGGGALAKKLGGAWVCN